MAIFEAESYDKIIEVLTHPEFVRTVQPDEANIMDRSKCQIFAGTTNTFWNTDLVSPCSQFARPCTYGFSGPRMWVQPGVGRSRL